MTDPTNRVIPQAGGEMKITNAEMREMFGDTVPVEAVLLLQEGDGRKTIGAIRDELRALAALRSPQPTPQAMGGEWRLVPVEPTGEMVETAFKQLGALSARNQIVLDYKAMLAAAPSSPAPSSAKVIEMDRERELLLKIEALVNVRETLKEALFPPEEKREDGSFVDHSADGNLDAAIIDLEMRGADKVCLNTLKKVLDRLYKARAALTDGGKG